MRLRLCQSRGTAQAGRRRRRDHDRRSTRQCRYGSRRSARSCTRLISELQPDVVVVERVFFQTNARTAMSVGQASGVALLTAVELGCEVAEYTSNEVKLAVTGFGAATKDQVQQMVARLLDLERGAEAPRRRRRSGARALPPQHGALGETATCSSDRGR